MRQFFALAIGAVGLAALNAAPARAQATTTFVSGFGFDTNPCTVAAPCRTFQHAHDVTAGGGQITMLDTAGYGAVTIIKKISIVNDGGGMAGITEVGSGVDAITIAVNPGDVVNLRGLTLNGVGIGRNGINFTGGGLLNIQNCVVRGFVNDGVLFAPSDSAAITVSDTIVSNNGQSGIVILPAGGTVTAHFERDATIGNGAQGFLFDTTASAVIQAKIVDSVAAGNLDSGFRINNSGGGAVTVIDSKAMSNATGLFVNDATYISNLTLEGNSVGFSANFPALLRTFGDNYIIDANNTGTLTPTGLQ